MYRHVLELHASKLIVGHRSRLSTAEPPLMGEASCIANGVQKLGNYNAGG
jgi:hypothetical protein